MLRQKRFWLGLVISFLLLILIFRQNDPGKLLDALRQAEYIYLLPALLLYFGGVGVRAIRWHFLLRSIKSIPTGSLFRTVVIGYAANDILPARIGDLVRAYVLGQQENVSKTTTLVTVVVERIFDALTMLTFIVASSFFIHFPAGWFPIGDAEFASRIRLVAVVFILAIGSLAVLAGMHARVNTLVEFVLQRLPLSTWRERLARLARSGLEGLGSLRSPVDSLLVYVLSVAAWLCEAGMYFLIALGFKISLSPAVFLLAAAVANLATIVPSTPGYVGVFDAPIVIVLTAFGIDQSVATSYTLVLHAALYFPVTLLGLYFAWRAGVSLTQVSRTREETLIPS